MSIQKEKDLKSRMKNKYGMHSLPQVILASAASLGQLLAYDLEGYFLGQIT